MMRSDLLYGLALIALIGIFAFMLRSSRAGIHTQTFSGQVRHVVDGDTFYLEGMKPAIRIFGIDAPESDEPGFRAATNALARLTHRRHVTCWQMDTDRYGRIVARCELPDGRDIGRVMIDQGHAREYCRFSKNYYGTC